MPDTQPAPDEPLEHVAMNLSQSWPHYWQALAKTREQLLERRPAKPTLPEGPLALQHVTYGVRLLARARSGLAASQADFAAAEACAVLMMMAEDYYIFLGMFAIYDDPALFDRYASSRTSRSDAEMFVRDVGVADWCADRGHALKDATGAVIRLDQDHVPAPTIETPWVVGVISRMRPDMSAPDDDSANAYQVIATLLARAITAYRDHLLPAVHDRRRYTYATKQDATLVTHSLVMCRTAIPQTMRIAARDDDADLDMAAITALRFLAQDMIFARTSPPETYDQLPFLTADEFSDIADPDSEIQAWIAAHAPPERPRKLGL